MEEYSLFDVPTADPAQLDSFEAKIQQLIDNFSLLREKYDYLKLENTNLKEENEMTQLTNSNRDEELRNWEDEKNSLQQKVSEIENELNFIKEQYHKLENTHRNAIQKIDAILDIEF
jgi:FtsZ-binding cell division protein ZapB